MGKKTKLITCRHCGQEIAASAKVCPHCGGKNKKPIYKRFWFWLLIVIVLIVVISSVSGNDSGNNDKKIGTVSSQGSAESAPEKDVSSSASAASEAPAQSQEEPAQTVYQVGDILKDGNMEIVYAASGDYTESNEFLQPAEGNKYIFLKFAFRNTSDRDDDSISAFSFECYADGYSCDAYYGGEEELSATLSPGRSTVGYLYYEVPKDAQKIEVEYETNFFTEEKITFLFDGDKDSGYVPEKNETATEGALQVGETIEGDDLIITYLSCKEDSSDNMFIVPKDGCRYITCEFEFENVSDDDEFVSSLSFDCYADGISCEGAYFRDDNISATLSAGRKDKGTVTFEVPKDAAVVEFEYVTDFWTSRRAVFDASKF